MELTPAQRAMLDRGHAMLAERERGGAAPAATRQFTDAQ
jgi:hypothetical protein